MHCMVSLCNLRHRNPWALSSAALTSPLPYKRRRNELLILDSPLYSCSITKDHFFLPWPSGHAVPTHCHMAIFPLDISSF